MRKILCVSAVAVSTLFGAIPAAQAQFKVTPEVGITMMKEGYENRRATVSPRLGVGVDYFFNKQEDGWAITSGLYYYYKRESYSYGSAMVENEDGKEDWISFPLPKYPYMSSMGNLTDLKGVEFVDADIRRDFLQLPVMAKYKWQINEDYALSAAAGLYVAVGVGGSYHAQFSDYEKGDEEGKTSTLKSDPYDNYYYERFDWGFTSRLSLQVKQVSGSVEI